MMHWQMVKQQHSELLLQVTPRLTEDIQQIQWSSSQLYILIVLPI